jgi:hypothetical protein
MLRAISQRSIRTGDILQVQVKQGHQQVGIFDRERVYPWALSAIDRRVNAERQVLGGKLEDLAVMRRRRAGDHAGRYLGGARSMPAIVRAKYPGPRCGR